MGLLGATCSTGLPWIAHYWNLDVLFSLFYIVLLRPGTAEPPHLEPVASVAGQSVPRGVPRCDCREWRGECAALCCHPQEVRADRSQSNPVGPNGWFSRGRRSLTSGRPDPGGRQVRTEAGGIQFFPVSGKQRATGSSPISG